MFSGLTVPQSVVVACIFATLAFLSLDLHKHGVPSEVAGAAWRKHLQLGRSNVEQAVTRDDVGGETAGRANNSRFARQEKYPVYCGAWQEDYSRLHASVLRGEVPQRYVVADGVSGLADNLAGAVTMFYVALLSDRAFFLSSSAGGDYSWAFNPRHIDWRWDGSRASLSTWAFRLEPADHNRFLPEPEYIRHGDLRLFGSEYAIIKASTNLGLTVALFNNNFHRGQLLRMGLRPETAFSCAMDFLFELRTNVFEEISAEVRALINSTALKIGIQIRVGDAVLVEHKQPDMVLEKYSAFFDCANEIQLTRRYNDSQPVVWYLISDSIEVRRVAREQYGSKLLTSIDAAVGHIVFESADMAQRVYRAAAAEIWLFSFTDFHIISQNSGFGKVAAFWSGCPTGVYPIFLDKTNPSMPHAQPRSCGVKEAETLSGLADENLSRSGAGI